MSASAIFGAILRSGGGGGGGVSFSCCAALLHVRTVYRMV